MYPIESVICPFIDRNIESRTPQHEFFAPGHCADKIRTPSVIIGASLSYADTPGENMDDEPRMAGYGSWSDKQ